MLTQLSDGMKQMEHDGGGVGSSLKMELSSAGVIGWKSAGLVATDDMLAVE